MHKRKRYLVYPPNYDPFAGKRFKRCYSKFQAWKVANGWGEGSRVMEDITVHPTRRSMWVSCFGDKYWDISERTGESK